VGNDREGAAAAEFGEGHTYALFSGWACRTFIASVRGSVKIVDHDRPAVTHCLDG
jgi:hypothetical protein